MYNELYIDILFLVNFMMDTFVLLLVRKILGIDATMKRILLGSSLGAFMTCFIVMLPIKTAAIKSLLLYFFVTMWMLFLILGKTKIVYYVKAYIVLYLSSFLLGGVFEWLSQYVRVMSVFFVVAIISYYVVLAIWRYIVYLRRIDEFQCKVTLYLNEDQCSLKALIDSGNCLVDPESGKPVCIIERNSIEPLLKKQGLTMFSFIPYSSIGNTNGELPTVQLGKICIHRNTEKWVEKPVIGICSQRLSSGGEYQMILNPDML